MANNARMRHPRVLHLLFVALFSTAYGVAPAHSELRIGGFTDFIYFATDDKSDAVSSSFKEGQFVLHFNSSLDNTVGFFAELTWTPGSSGFGTEVERAILKYEHSDVFKPSAGRYHTPISWWNTAYHHGAWLQTSIDRPRAVRFGSNFLPIHMVGAMVEGKVFPNGLSVSYAGGVGNGRNENLARAGDAGDADNHRALLLQLGLRPDIMYDLEVGAAVYFDRMPVKNGPPPDEQILSAYVVLAREKPEFLGEFFFVRHEDDTTHRNSGNTSYYVQAAYRLPIWNEILKPYARVETIDIDNDPVFDGLEQDTRRFLAGIRIDFAAMAAFKLEGRRGREGIAPYANEMSASLAVAF